MTCSTSLVHYKFLKSDIKVASTLATEDILSKNAGSVSLLSPAPPLRKLYQTKNSSTTSSPISELSPPSPLSSPLLLPSGTPPSPSLSSTSSLSLATTEPEVIKTESGSDIVLKTAPEASPKTLSPKVSAVGLPFMIDRLNHMCNSVNGCREELHISNDITGLSNMNNNLRRLSNGHKEHHLHQEQQSTQIHHHQQQSQSLPLPHSQDFQEQCATNNNNRTTTTSVVNSLFHITNTTSSSSPQTPNPSSAELPLPLSSGPLPPISTPLQSGVTGSHLPLLSSFLKPDINEKESGYINSISDEKSGSEAKLLLRAINNELNGGSGNAESFGTLDDDWSLQKENLRGSDTIRDKLPHESMEIVEDKTKQDKDEGADDVPKLISTDSTAESEEPHSADIPRSDSQVEEQFLEESGFEGLYPKENDDNLDDENGNICRRPQPTSCGVFVKSGMEYEQDCLSLKCKKALKRLNKLGLKMTQRIVKSQLEVFANSQRKIIKNDNFQTNNHDYHRYLHSSEGSSFSVQATIPGSSGTISGRKLKDSHHSQKTDKTSALKQRLTEQKNFLTLNSLKNSLTHLQKGYDSDATESDDDDFNLHFNPANRSSGKRTAVLEQELNSCRTNTNWLNVMCKETEMRHQKSEFLRKFCRNARGQIVFGTSDEASNTSRFVPSFVYKKGNKEFSNSDEEIEDVIIENKMQKDESDKVTLVEEAKDNNDTVEENIEEESCMRTMPYKGMKRRRVVNVEATLSLLKKVTLTGQYTEKSSVRCLCSCLSKELSSCLLCRGEFNSSVPIHTEQMPLGDRLKLMKASYHNVMSLPDSLPAGFYFAEMLASNTFKNKFNLIRSQIKKKKSQSSHNTLTVEVGVPEKPPKKYLPSGIPQRPKKEKKDKAKQSSKLSASMITTTSTEIKKRSRLSYDSRLDSPPISPASSEISLFEPSAPTATQKRRRSDAQHAYDINNIVIPFHMTYTSKIEKLEYKEIITPAWIYREDYSIPFPDDYGSRADVYLSIDDQEDITDEGLLRNHAQAEEIERARITANIVPPRTG